MMRKLAILTIAIALAATFTFAGAASAKKPPFVGSSSTVSLFSAPFVDVVNGGEVAGSKGEIKSDGNWVVQTTDSGGTYEICLDAVSASGSTPHFLTQATADELGGGIGGRLPPGAVDWRGLRFEIRAYTGVQSCMGNLVQRSGITIE